MCQTAADQQVELWGTAELQGAFHWWRGVQRVSGRRENYFGSIHVKNSHTIQ